MWSWKLGNNWKNTIPGENGWNGFLRRVYVVTLHEKVRSCEIRKALNVEQLLLRSERSQLPLLTVCRNITRKIGEACPAGCAHGKAAQRSSKDQVEWINLRSVWSRVGVWSQKELSEIAVDHEVSRVHLGLLPPRPSLEEKREKTSIWMGC